MPMNELTFASFLQGEQATTNESTETQTETTPVESQEATGTEATTEVVESQEQVAPSTAAAPSVSLAALLEKKGVQVEGGDSEELYESVISRALAGSQALSEVQRLRDELESLRAATQLNTSTAPNTQQATPVSQQSTPEGETAAQQRSRMFRELQQYDRLLERYVERDENGIAVPVAAYGQVSIDAARQINDYERASREQADLLLRNPLAIFKDAEDDIKRIAEERAKAIVAEQIAAIRAEQEQVAKAQEAAQLQKSLQQQENEWHESNKALLFHLDQNGNPKDDFFGSGGPAWTAAGKKFIQKLAELREQIPGAPDLTLRNIALDFARSAVPTTQAHQAAPATQTQAAPESVLTQAQKKQNLLANNRQSVPNSNTPVANVHQAMAGTRVLRFAEMVRQHPENAERISGWR